MLDGTLKCNDVSAWLSFGSLTTAARELDPAVRLPGHQHQPRDRASSLTPPTAPFRDTRRPGRGKMQA
ncbi:MAG: hypothetical protein GPOALKHO_001868 [Sodalis sp.]|nr:MAG: hypothetical protein GPOALKHO_001868 [Sodalis sp.]